MTFNRLGEDRVLIILARQDMTELSLNLEEINYIDSRSRNELLKIMHSACQSSGIETGGKRINIEAIALDESCYLLVTVGGRRRGYRLKKSGKSICYCLGGSGNFLDAVEQLYRQNVCCEKNSAYELGGEYFLVFDYPAIPKGLRRVLCEYGDRRRDKLICARLRESGKPVCTRDAIRQIGKHLV